MGATIIIKNTIGTFAPGNTVTMVCSIKNTGSTTQTFGVGAEIITSATTAETPTATTPLLSPNTSGTVTILYTTPSALPVGTGTAHAVVWSGTPGESNNLNGNYQPITIQYTLPVTGRLCYQVSSTDNTILPAPNSPLGDLMVYILPKGPAVNLTGTLGVIYAFNPHFSSDGSRIVFDAEPATTGSYNRNSLEVYSYSFASGTLNRLTQNSVPDEDASFSPSGQQIVFKNTITSGTNVGQIWSMTSNGSDAVQLTSTSIEVSGPNYSPDGTSITYWSGTGANASIYTMNSNGSNQTPIDTPLGFYQYYPSYSSTGNILYTRNVSTNNANNQIYSYSISSSTSQSLPTNLTEFNNSDAFAVNSSFIGFSSDRSGGVGGYDMYLGNTSTGMVYGLPSSSSTFDELGGTYTPYSHSRELDIVSPAPGSNLVAGGTTVITVTGWSDGGPWAGASPSIGFQKIGASGTTQYSLNDDGMSEGAETYSATVTLPQTTGSYKVIATGTSIDNNLSNVIASTPVTVSLPITVLQNWRLTYFGTTSNSGSAADTATPYNNGVPNLAAFAFLGPNVNPAAVTISQLPQVQIKNGNIFYNFTQPSGVGDVNYVAESSTNLTTWTSVANSDVSPAYFFTKPMTGFPKLFLQLIVTGT